MDKLPCSVLPHYHSWPNVQYLQLDLFDVDFYAQISERVSAVGQRVYIVGMHLCGQLSVVAIELSKRCTHVAGLLLSPCCLPNHQHRSSPAHLYASSDPLEQYRMWALHLAELIGTNNGVAAHLEYDANILSERCAIIYGCMY